MEESIYHMCGHREKEKPHRSTSQSRRQGTDHLTARSVVPRKMGRSAPWTPGNPLSRGDEQQL